MLIKVRRGWELPESSVTPEAVAFGRRALLAAGVAGGMAVGTLALPRRAEAAVERNPRYTGGRPLTAEKWATTYNNYYEFGTSKDIWEDAKSLPQRPWSISIEGLVANPRSIAIDDLLKQVTLEERVYRHRCVEAWSMVVPWTGFPLAALVKLAEPKPEAQYVAFQTLNNPKLLPGEAEPFYPWPYVEGVTIAEANNELAFISTGIYGKPMPPQNGGPIRLTLPWKYGFKSCKAISKITFTDKRPKTFWDTLLPSEYGFWANVNPAVPHPRWSQARERVLGTSEMVPTEIYNGYGEFVAGLYAGMTDEKLFM